MIGTSIALVHATTKERVSLVVETIASPIVTVRWGASGLYELDTRTNTVRAYSQKTRRAHQRGALLWSAEDIEGVRRALKIATDGEDRSAITAKQSAAHHASMPQPSGVDVMIERMKRR